MHFAFVDVLTVKILTCSCLAIVFFDLTSIVIRCRSVEIHGVIKAAHSDPVYNSNRRYNTQRALQKGASRDGLGRIRASYGGPEWTRAGQFGPKQQHKKYMCVMFK